MKNDQRLIVIAGPTGVGKTALAIRVATALKTEIVSADSRQIFREMTIGTAKPTQEELNQAPHHFINTQSITDDYDAGKYGREALDVINELFQKHQHVVLCGGSGLYITAVCDGFDDMPEIPEGTRDTLNLEYQEKGLEWLQQQVAATDPEYFEVVDQKNHQRLIRALELYRSTGKTTSELRKKKKYEHPFQIIKAGLALDKDILDERIDQRADNMIKDGLIDEARSLYPQRALNALQTVGYQEFFGYFDGAYDKEEAIRLLKRNTRQYAKRQLTWFRKDKEINWFGPDEWEAVLALALKSHA